MKVKKTILPFLAALLPLFVFSACGGGPDAAEETPSASVAEETPSPSSGSGAFTINYNSGDYINPYISGSAVNLEACGLIYEGLFALTGDFTARNVLCDYYETGDKLTYLITIKQEIQFSNGADLTAADVVYSLECAMESDMYKGRLSIIDSVDEVSDEDDPDGYTIRIVLSRAHGNLPVLLGVPIIEFGSLYNHCPAGTGPYALDNGGSSPQLRANAYYSGSDTLPTGTISLREVEPGEALDAIESETLDLVGGVDLTDYSASALALTGDVRSYSTTIMSFLGYNLSSEHLQNLETRLAISHAIDRESIISTAMSGAGIAAVMPIHPANVNYSEALAEEYAFDINVSAEILSGQSGIDFDLQKYMEGAEVETGISLTLLVNEGSGDRAEAAAAIKASLAKLGIAVEVVSKSYDQYIDALEAGEFDLYLGQTQLTPDFNFSALVIADGTLNFGGVFNSEYGSLINNFLARSTPDTAEDMCRYVLERTPFTVIGFKNLGVATGKSAVSNMIPLMENIYDNVVDWRINIG